jgi:ubiquinone/menaquinone biosynthesis C-methylase UbiE
MDDRVSAAATLDWDYSALAEHYRLRAPYADAALRDLFALMRLPTGAACADIGAGTGRLTAALVAQSMRVDAIEPNAAMRAIGRRDVPQARWLATRGEATELSTQSCALLTFGSSFNVMPARAALDEAARVLRPRGWLVCLWNHRDLDEPLQQRLQAAIEQHVPGYEHGQRREDPSPLLIADGRFGAVHRIVGRCMHATPARDFVAAFRAHATLVRQAGDAMPRVLEALEAVVAREETIAVPFITRIFATCRNAVR